MERIEFSSLAELRNADVMAEKEGYSDTKTIENIPVGACSGSLVLSGTKNNKIPQFALIKFERKDKQGNEIKLKFRAVSMNVLHVSSGKTYNDTYVKLVDELETALSKAENYTKTVLMNSESYVDGAGRQRTALKFESISR